jgi:hypothetical protein
MCFKIHVADRSMEFQNRLANGAVAQEGGKVVVDSHLSHEEERVRRDLTLLCSIYRKRMWPIHHLFNLRPFSLSCRLGEGRGDLRPLRHPRRPPVPGIGEVYMLLKGVDRSEVIAEL